MTSKAGNDPGKIEPVLFFWPLAGEKNRTGSFFRQRHVGRGFTLIELVFVAFLLGMLTVSALPPMRRQWLDLRAERTAREIAQGWRAARTLAVAWNRQVDWIWDARARTIRLAAADDAPRLEARWGKSQPVPADVAVRVRQEGQAVARVSFFPDGTSGTPEGAASATACTVGSAATAARYAITLDPATGQVRVQLTPPTVRQR